MKPETPKRTRLSNDVKLAIIEAAKKKGGKEGYKEEAMKTYHISKSAYYNIFRDFEPKVVDSPARGNAKSLKGVSEVHAEFEKRLFQWLLWADAGGLPVNGPNIMTQGEIIAQEMKLDHNCSVGWLDGFKKRHDLHFKKSHGEKQL